MKIIFKILLFVTVFTVMFSCSTKKDTVISRNFHAITTKYNILFNGNESLKKGITAIESKYEDDYWNLLPIEPLQFDEDKIVIPFSGPGAGFGGRKSNQKKELTPFEKAEEKAVKAIQLHSMNIKGREKNRQIDNAYLLLGKARYYDQRFIPAVEAFNYVIANYPYADLINETKIWRAKANIRLENEELAIESLKFLLEIKEGLESKLPSKIKELAHTTLAMAYLQTDSIEKAKKQLLFATTILENKEQSARNLFILGQLYSQQKKKDSASLIFQKLIAFKKSPYKYKIHAEIELAKNVSKDSSVIAIIERFDKLIKNIDNRPYLDKLYYQRAVLKEKNDSIASAIADYNKSLRSKNGSVKQKTFTYESLGNLYFNQDNYLAANSYYDSVIQVAKETQNLRIRRVIRKHKNLASLIKFENILTINDSILRIASMSADEQQNYFKTYIEKLKKADEEKAQQQLNAAAFNTGSLQSTGGKKGAWYFYNNQIATTGKVTFQQVWGNIKLMDNWRWSNKTTASNTNKENLQVQKDLEKYDINTYLSKIPRDKQALDSLQKTRNNALYELGLIYKEQFKNPKLAIQRLERLLQLKPKKELLLPIHYHLYKIYDDLGNKKQAAIHKKIVVTTYKDSPFAQVILHPKETFKEEKIVTEIEEKYKEVYYLYKGSKFKETIKKIDSLLPKIQHSKLIPKFELLKAYAIGKMNDKKTYKKALNFVAINYSGTEEGKKAKEIVKRLQ